MEWLVDQARREESLRVGWQNRRTGEVVCGRHGLMVESGSNTWRALMEGDVRVAANGETAVPRCDRCGRFLWHQAAESPPSADERQALALERIAASLERMEPNRVSLAAGHGVTDCWAVAPE